MTTEKVIIIGGGPTGLSGAIYNARADLYPLVIAGSVPGGQLMLTSDVENYPGFASIKGPELISAMRKHAEKFGARLLNETVERINLNQKPFSVMLVGDKTVYQAETLLLATGADAVWLNLPSEQRLRGRGVSACATCDGFFFKEKIVGVVGGGDTAMEEALTLTKFAAKVYLMHRQDQFRASKIMQKRVFTNPKIEVIWNAQVEEVLGENKVEGVKLKLQGESLKSKVLTLNGLFIAIGHKPATAFLKENGILLDEKGYIITSSRAALEYIKYHPVKGGINIKNFDFNYQYMTSVPGVFAAGDVIDPDYRQAGTAVGMGVAAGLEIERYLDQSNDL